MDFNATIDLIIKDLDEARVIIDDLKQYPGVPALQVELAKSKCKSAADVISLLRETEKASSPVATGYLKPIPGELMAKSFPDVPARDLQPGPESENPAQQTLPAEPEGKAINAVTEIFASDELRAAPAGSGEKSGRPHENMQDSSKTAESTIIAERFSNLSPRINEQLGTAWKEDLSALAKPVLSLSDAIGINDRFLFIREIFNGDSAAYNGALAKLDNASGLDDARAILMSYTGQNQDNDASRQMLDLLKRKFQHNG